MSTKEPKKNIKSESSPPETTSEEKEDNLSIEEEEDSIDNWLDNIKPKAVRKTSNQSKTDDVSESTEQTSSTQSHFDNLIAEFVRQLPNWINKPWMYVKPTHDGHLKNWLDSWKQLILKYTSIFTKHIVLVYDLQNLHPFTHENSGKDLSIEEIKTIIDHMVEENLAKWLDNDNNRARIYFKTDHEWADILYQFTLDQGYASDVMTLYELQNLDQDWSNLPDEELRLVLNILVNEDKAEWIGKENDTVQFKI